MLQGSNHPRTRNDYVVAIVCAMTFEMSAFRYMLDREHPRLSTKDGDSNVYVLGEVAGHDIVLACLPGQQGKGAAAVVATNLSRTFPSIKWRFLVGIGGGVPSDKNDIRLGDVVISFPEGTYGGVVQYDLGKETESAFTLKGAMCQPPPLLRGAVQVMQSDHLIKDNKIEEFVSDMLKRGQRLSTYQRPPEYSDILFRDDCPHITGATCEQCDLSRTVDRPQREVSGSAIHYGLIASGDSVIRSSNKRVEIATNLGNIICFEMEAAGLMTEFPCIVIRGIADYADSHKNDEWQHYAAAAAAATTKELLSYFESKHPSETSATSLSTTESGSSGTEVINSTFIGRGIHFSGSGNMCFGDVSIS